MKDRLVVGTRKSALALWQSEFVRSELEKLFPGLRVELQHIVTKGDLTQGSSVPIPAIGGKGLFTAELEDALLAGEIDLAVHSLKDLPTEIDSRFCIGAIPARGSHEDVLISRTGAALDGLPTKSVVGTSSVRRASQILRARPDLTIAHIRGNVDTRLRKLRAEGGEFDAIVLARAGLERLELHREVTEVLTPAQMLPAPGQGALGIECRADDAAVLSMLQRLHDMPSALAVSAERSFLQALGAGCNTPVAAYVQVEQQAGGFSMSFWGRCLSPDGTQCIEVREARRSDTIFSLQDAEGLGRDMAQQAVQQGFKALCPAA
jgi:hydroxymethylbilane synthase